MNSTFVVSVHVGKIAPLGPQREPSGFVKHAVTGPIQAGPLGLAGDEQADLRVHGGPEKAVYAYAVAHYPAWRAEFPDLTDRFVPGGVGENLAIGGLTEDDIRVGDIHAIGSAELQVCQPRQPCFKFALRFENNRLPKAMVRNGRSGWYYRVVKPGVVQSGDTVVLAERPNPDFPFARLVQIVNHGGATPDEIRRMAGMPGLARQLRVMARQALDEAGEHGTEG